MRYAHTTSIELNQPTFCFGVDQLHPMTENIMRLNACCVKKLLRQCEEERASLVDFGLDPSPAAV